MFKKILEAKTSMNWKKLLSLILFSGVVVTVLAEPALAQENAGAAVKVGTVISEGIGAAVAFVLSIFALIFNAVIGLFITLMIKILVNVASFDNIIDVPTVVKGWLVIRDLCNMVFILIFLFIAFATILRIESFSVKRALPKLLIVAVLINFSRSIFGVIIDFSQVIMLAFVHSFSDGQGWFIDTFNTQHLMGIDTDNESSFSNWDTVVATIAGMFGAIITLIVIIVLVCVLIMRLVLLWIYTILSPLAFLGFAFDPLKKYVGFIWSDFIKQAMIGPLLAFFIWLALTTVKESATQLGGAQNEITVAQSAFFGDADFQRFLIAIALLIGGLIAAQKIGGAAGSAAGRGMEAIKGKYGPTPMRRGRETWDAFQQKRSAERKEKIQKSGERLYGLYKGVTQKPGAIRKGAQQATDFYPVQSLKRLSGQAANIPGVKNARQWWKNKQDHQEEFFKTFNQGESRVSENGKYRYEISDNGEKVTAYKADTNERVTSMKKREAEYRKGYKQGFSPAKQIKDEIMKKRIDEKEKELSGLSAAEIREKVEDKNVAGIDRMAASLKAVKDKVFQEGNSEREKRLFESAKRNVGSSAVAQGSFNEEADKYYAAWNNTKDGFMNKFKNGKIDTSTQHLSQFKDKPEWFIEAAGDKAGDVVKAFSERGAKAQETVKNTLAEKLNQYEQVDLSDPIQKQVRNIFADITGNIDRAFKDNQGRYSRQAQENYIRGAKSDKLDRILKHRNEAPPEEGRRIDDVLRQTVTSSQLDNYSKKDYSGSRTELLRRLHQEGRAQRGPAPGEAGPTSGSGQFGNNSEE
jgi:hypothetical protein